MASKRIKQAIALLDQLDRNEYLVSGDAILTRDQIKRPPPPRIQTMAILIKAGRDDLLSTIAKSKRPRGRKSRTFDKIEIARADSKLLREHSDFTKLEADEAAATRLFDGEDEIAETLLEMNRRDVQGSHKHRAK